MKTSLIKVQNPKTIDGYKYYLLTKDENDPTKRMVVKITEKQANEFLSLQKNQNAPN